MPPLPSPPTHTHTRTLPVLYHTTPSLHLFITPFRSCKSSKVNFSLNLPRARRRRHCIVVRRCSTRTILYTHKLRLMNERKTDFPGTLRLHHWQPLYLIYIYTYVYKTLCVYDVRALTALAFHRFVFGGIFFPVNNNNILLFSPHASRCLVAAKCNINY